MRRGTFVHVLALGAILTLLAAPVATAETAAGTPDLAALEADLFSAPEAGCGDAGAAATPEGPGAQQPRERSSTFYVCLSSDILCGGCPSGTRCATEAYNFFAPCCTFVTACVVGCQESPSCSSICEPGF